MKLSDRLERIAAKAAEVTEGKYTYSQMLTILEAFSDDELAVFGQCTFRQTARMEVVYRISLTAMRRRKLGIREPQMVQYIITTS